MPRYVALLRGVNVGRTKRIAMADLRALLLSLGYTDARTVLASGNAVFDTDADAGNAPAHAQKIQAAIARSLGVETRVIGKSARDFAAAVAGNELASMATDPARLLVAFTAEAGTLRALRAMKPAAASKERLHVGRAAAYLWCPDGLLVSPLAVALLKDHGDAVTTRNWATVQKIDALLRAGSA